MNFSIVAALAISLATAEKRVDALFAHVNDGRSPGAAVVVIHDGKVILRKGYGLADLEHHIPITPSTVFDTASLSKQFTGAAIAALAAEGKIKVTDDVRKYIPELHDFGTPITIEQLLRHRSGLRDWPSTLSIAGWRMDDPVTLNHVLTMAYNQKTLNFTPGTEYRYSNTGYNLLAEVVQRVSGRPFASFLSEKFFQPLGMRNTHLLTSYTEVIPNRAYGYSTLPDGTFGHTPNHLVAPGSSGVFSTVDDFARWLVSGQVPPDGYGVKYGEYSGRRFFSTLGGWASFNAYDAYFPDEKFGVIVFSNAVSRVVANDTARHIADIYFGIEEPAAAPPSPPSAPLDDYPGLYDPLLRIERIQSILLARTPHAAGALLSPKGRDEFVIHREDDEIAVTFHRDDNGRVTSLTYGDHEAKRTAEPQSPPDLTQFTGDFDSEELGASYRVAIKDGALQLVHRHRGTIPLRWLWRDEFGSMDAYIGSVDFRRDAEGHVTALVINGDRRSSNLVFTKRR